MAVPEDRAHHFCIIKAFVIPKPRRPNAFRDVWDERPVNRELRTLKFKFETLDTVARMMGKGWWFATLDLKDAYHHIGLSPRSSRFCAFRWMGRIIVSLVLNFGLSPAPWLFTKVMRAPIAFWRANGLFVVIYLDDLILMAPTKEELEAKMQVVAADLERLGLTVNWEKSKWFPQQRGEYLGLTIDTLKGVFEITPEQLGRLKAELDGFLSASRGAGVTVPARQAAKLAGRILCWKRALPQVTLFAHDLVDCLRRMSGQWGRDVFIPDPAVRDLQWLREHLDQWNGHSMWKASRLLVLRLTSDAGEHFWAAEMLLQDRLLPLRGPLPLDLVGASSTARELFGTCKRFVR